MSWPTHPVRYGPWAAAVAAAVAAVAAARPVRRVEVAGRSMAPTLLPGDRLLVVRPLPTARRERGPRLSPGDLVAVRDPRLHSRLLVKRLTAVDHGAGTAWVLGDAPAASTDSRSFGAVPLRSIVGRAVYRYAPAGRAGRGPWDPPPGGAPRSTGDGTGRSGSDGAGGGHAAGDGTGHAGGDGTGYTTDGGTAGSGSDATGDGTGNATGARDGRG